MMTTKQHQKTALLKEIENSLATKSHLSSDLKASLLANVKKQLEEAEHTTSPNRLVKIPSLGEFDKLLDIVSPQSRNGLFWKAQDLVLLNVDENTSIIFYHNATKPRQDDTKQTEDKNKDEEEKKFKLVKLISKQNENDGIDTSVKNTLAMGNFDEFSCLLSGSCVGLSTIDGDIGNNSFLDQVLSNVATFFGKSYSKADISFAKQEIENVLPLLINLLNWKKEKKGNNKNLENNESLLYDWQ